MAGYVGEGGGYYVLVTKLLFMSICGKRKSTL